MVRRPQRHRRSWPVVGPGYDRRINNRVPRPIPGQARRHPGGQPGMEQRLREINELTYLITKSKAPEL